MAVETINGEHWSIVVGDVMDGLAAISSGSVHCCVTSPPYWNLRDYGFNGQIGSEATPDDFVATMVKVFADVRRVMRDDGVLFVNLGDSYNRDPAKGGSGPNGKNAEYSDLYGKSKSIQATVYRHMKKLKAIADEAKKPIQLQPGDKIGIPWRVALAMQKDGWILRQDMVWAKPSPMPESVSDWRWRRCRIKTGSFQTGAKWIVCPGCDKCRDNGGMVLRKGSWRPTTSHEYIFQFVKSQNYFADGDGSKEPAVKGASGSRFDKGKTGKKDGGDRAQKGCRESDESETRNQRSVWRLSPEGFTGAHFATFPTELPRRCIISATSRGGCCSACGSQYAPIIESKRTATRPGTNSKVNRVSVHDESPYQDHSGDICGNRDPQRHTTTTVVTGYLPTCKCNATVGRPVVLDCFGGSMTTGQVAINMGCDFIGLEGNPKYAQLGVKRLETPWTPVGERKKKTTKTRRPSEHQNELF